MARFIQNNPMAGVGNAERLALMKAQFDIDKAKQPTAVDRLSQFGQEIINYQADKAKVQVMAQQKQQQAEAQRREQVLDMKFKAGAPMEDKDFTDLGMDPAKGREWMAQKQEAEARKSQSQKTYAKQLKAVSGEWVIFNPLDGSMTGTGETIQQDQKKRPYSVVRIKDPLTEETKFFRWDPNLGELVEIGQDGAVKSQATPETPAERAARIIAENKTK